jgi:hypothetical protein
MTEDRVTQRGAHALELVSAQSSHIFQENYA